MAGNYRLIVQWVILFLFQVYDTIEADVTLQVYGPDVRDVLTICPDNDYIIVFECIVTENRGLIWSVEPFFHSLPVGQSFDFGNTHFQDFTVVLIEKSSDMFEAQIMVPTSVLSKNTEVEVVCTDSEMQQMKRKFIKVAGGTVPLIQSAHVEKENGDGILRVSWSSNITDTVKIAVIAENVDHAIKRRVIVEAFERQTGISVCPKIPYNVTVIVYNKCNQSFASEIFPVFDHVEDHINVLPTSTTKGVQNTCAATSQCGSINGLIAGMILVFLLLLIMAIAAFAFALMLKKYHTKYSSIKGKFQHTNPVNEEETKGGIPEEVELEATEIND